MCDWLSAKKSEIFEMAISFSKRTVHHHTGSGMFANDRMRTFLEIVSDELDVFDGLRNLRPKRL